MSSPTCGSPLQWWSGLTRAKRSILQRPCRALVGHLPTASKARHGHMASLTKSRREVAGGAPANVGRITVPISSTSSGMPRTTTTWREESYLLCTGKCRGGQQQRGKNMPTAVNNNVTEERKELDKRIQCACAALRVTSGSSSRLSLAGLEAVLLSQPLDGWDPRDGATGSRCMIVVYY
eukprot:1196429-Prorocentrum_minimum.AAC.8